MKTVLPRFTDIVVRIPDEFDINCGKKCKLSQQDASLQSETSRVRFPRPDRYGLKITEK